MKRRWNKHITQRNWVENQFKQHGEVSRNEALSLCLTRLSGYVGKLREEGWKIEGKYVKYERGMDYRYYLLEKPTQRKRLVETNKGDIIVNDKGEVVIKRKQVELF